MGNAHTQSTTVPPSGENRNAKQNAPHDEHSDVNHNGQDEHGYPQDEGIIETLRSNKLVIPLKVLSITIFFGLTTFHNPNEMNVGMKTFLQLLPISFTAFLIGIPLHKKHPGTSDKLKLIGYGCMFLGIFGVMSSYLWFYAAVIPIMCAIVATGLLLMAWFKKL